jgi:hypothetical protein
MWIQGKYEGVNFVHSTGQKLEVYIFSRKKVMVMDTDNENSKR